MKDEIKTFDCLDKFGCDHYPMKFKESGEVSDECYYCGALVRIDNVLSEREIRGSD